MQIIKMCKKSTQQQHPQCWSVVGNYRSVLFVVVFWLILCIL